MGSSRLPVQFIFMGVLAFVAGIYNLMDYSEGWIYIVIGIILVLVGLAIITLQKSVYLDTSQNQLISVWCCLFWYRKEYKKQLPEMSYLTVVSVKTTQLSHYISLAFPFYYSECKCNVNLAFNSSRMRYLNLITVKKTKAFEYALYIAEKANIPVLDATERKKKWVKSEGEVIFKK